MDRAGTWGPSLTRRPAPLTSRSPSSRPGGSTWPRSTRTGRGLRSEESLLAEPMLFLFAALALAGCGRASAREPQLFELLSPGRTGVTFANRLPDDSAFNILTYMYYYDGGGVAVGDVDN